MPAILRLEEGGAANMRREVARGRGSWAQHGDEVERAPEVAPGAQREVARRDRGHEAVVEAPRDAEPRVDRIPPEALDANLVDRELAGVEQAVELDVGEVRAAQVAELARAVLAHVPRVAGTLRPGRRER